MFTVSGVLNTASMGHYDVIETLIAVNWSSVATEIVRLSEARRDVRRDVREVKLKRCFRVESS